MADARASRRDFVGGIAIAATAAAAAWAGGARVRGATTQAAPPVPVAPASPPVAAARQRRLLTPEEFQARLEGPIQSGASPFTADFSVDYAGVRNMVARGLHYGIRVFAMTAGNGQYHALEQSEIRGIAAAMVEAANDDAVVIAATGDWWTGLTVNFARYSEAVGADAVQVMLPSRAENESAIVQHFEAVASATKLPIVLHGQFSAPLLRKLLPAVPTIVAMKEDGELAYYIDRQIEFGDRLNIFGGGAESRFLVGQPYGAKAFYSTYSGFAPDISIRFWEAARRGDIKAAADITRRYDHPFISRFTHPFWHATLEHFGVAQRYMRPPQTSYTDEQMTEVKAFFDAQGLRPEKYR
jgi:dihydrodipicolinate synthase/N-acetylneuraminate lyase